MANTLTAFNPEYWSKRMQILLRKMLVGKSIANFEERALLQNGDKVHRSYISDPRPVAYTKGTAVTIQDIAATDESLTVDQSYVVPVYVDDVDVVQNNVNVANALIDRSAHMLGRRMDHDVLKQVENAALDIDDGDIGGTAGNSIVLSTSNAVNTFGSAHAELANNNVELDKDWYLCIDPFQTNIIMQSFVSSGFTTADLSLRNGFLGEFLGFKVFQSNALLATADVNIATNPSEGDTVVVNGVTFTFNATPSGAGSVDIGGSAAVSVDNLVAAINDSGTAGSTYIQLTGANRSKLVNNQVVATDGTTKLTLKAAGRMTLSETFTDTTDNIGIQTVKSAAGRMGATDLVIQKEATVDIRKASLKLGRDILTHALWGVKQFNEGDQRSCEINIQASAATASS